MGRPSKFFRGLSNAGSLTQRVARGGIWTVVGFGTQSALRLVSNLILTRLLAPEIFGLMSLAQVFLNGVKFLSDAGVQTSVIRSDRGEDPDFLRTAWTLQILRGLLITAICLAIAFPVSLAYDEPTLFPLISALAFASAINGFRSISIARANRKLMIRNLTIMNVLAQVITVCITVFFAWQLRSVWALVIGAVTGNIAQVALSYLILPPFRHRLRFEAAAFWEIFRFGRWILLGSFFTFLGNRGQQAIFGLFVPIEVVGLLAIATLLSSVPNQFFAQLISTVLFPSFSELVRERPEALQRAIFKVRLVAIGIALPTMFTLAVLAQPIVDFLYDPRYAATGPILALMALNGSMPILSTIYQQIILADGRSDLHAFLTFVWSVLTILGILAGFGLYGLMGSFLGIGLAQAIMFFVTLAIARRRGIASGWIDLVAAAIVGVGYALILSIMDIPPAFLSPVLVGEIAGG